MSGRRILDSVAARRTIAFIGWSDIVGVQWVVNAANGGSGVRKAPVEVFVSHRLRQASAGNLIHIVKQLEARGIAVWLDDLAVGEVTRKRRDH